jgi:TrkA-C domain
VLVLGIIYMVFAGRLLASGEDDPVVASRRPSLETCIEQYRLTDREYRVRVTSESPLVGQRLDELSLRAAGVNIVAIVRSLRLGTESRRLRNTRLTVATILTTILTTDSFMVPMRTDSDFSSL